MLTKNNLAVFIIALVISVLASFFGLSFSFHYDFPAGSSIVAILGVIFILASVYKMLTSGFTRKTPANA
jgi:ABC-type Mn2+/Zn2+ transport system permease subunit